MWITVVAALSAALASGFVPAQSPTQKTAEYRIIQTPGPRGTVRWVRTEAQPAEARCDGRIRYKLVQLPGPRSGTRLVKRCDAERRGSPSKPNFR